MRRTREDAEKTKQAILDAAIKVFNRRGVARATLAEVAKAAHVTRGAVYWHFKDKNDLFTCLYETMTRSLNVRPEDYASRTYATLAAFKEDIYRYFQSFETDHRFHMFMNVLYSRVEYIDELQPIIETEKGKQRAMVNAFEKALTALQSNGEINSQINCHRIALILYAVMDGIVDSWGIDDDLYVDRNNGISDVLDELFQLLETPV